MKVTDDEITAYVNNHKEEYKQEETRGIEYVTLNAAPTKADSTSIYNQVEALKAEFDSTADAETFLISNSSEAPFYDAYVLKSKMQVTNTDTIQQLQPGMV